MVRKNAHDNVVYVSGGYDTDKQYGDTLLLTEMHYISGNPWSDEALAKGVEITFKNRHTPEFTDATMTLADNGDYVVRAAHPIQGIAPGQFCVIYDKERRRCFGSGIITGGSVIIDK